MNPSIPLDVAVIGCTPGSSNCDPAIDLTAPNVAAKLSAYERERSPEALAALPLKPDGKLSLFRIQPLTAAGSRVVMAESGTKRWQTAFVVACHEFTDARGVTHKASDHGGLQVVGKLTIASDDWLDFVTITCGYGGKVVAEVGCTIVLRAEVGAEALAPFALPPGAMLAR